MRILFITRGYPTEEYPLNGIFEYDQAKALVQKGHEVIYGAIDLRSIRRSRKMGSYVFQRDGMIIEAINYPIGNIANVVLDYLRIRYVNKLYHKVVSTYGNIDAVHSHFIWFNHATVKALAHEEVYHVATEHYSAMNAETIEPYYYHLAEKTYHQVDTLIAVSNYLAKNLYKNFRVNPEVIPNSLDIAMFYGIKGKKIKEPFSFVSLGRLEKLKGMELLIKAFHGAFGGREDVVLRIIGQGKERKALESLVQELQMKDQVFFLGQQPRQEISKIFVKSDAFVLASPFETFGVALVEALASGLPVIATAKGGPEDFIDEKNGILLRDYDETKLAEAMIALKDNIREYDPEEISNTIKEIYAPQAIATKLEAVYQRSKRLNSIE